MRPLPVAAVLLALTGSISSATAQGLHAVSPLQGYACMMLNLNDVQMQDNSVQIPVYAGPSVASGKVGIASAIVIARNPLHVVDGYAELLFPTGQHVWIQSNMLRPYHNQNDPDPKCRPSMMSNGRPGFG